MTNLPEQIEDQGQPRPVVTAAQEQNTRSKWVGAVTAVLGALPALLIAFEVIAWSGEQIAAYTAFLGVASGAVSLATGASDVKTALAVEATVTPVASPRNNDGSELVPIVDG